MWFWEQTVSDLSAQSALKIHFSCDSLHVHVIVNFLLDDCVIFSTTINPVWLARTAFYSKPTWFACATAASAIVDCNLPPAKTEEDQLHNSNRPLATLRRVSVFCIRPSLPNLQSHIAWSFSQTIVDGVLSGPNLPTSNDQVAPFLLLYKNPNHHHMRWNQQYVAVPRQKEFLEVSCAHATP